MAYSDQVAYITKMRPELLHLSAQELSRVAAFIASVASHGITAQNSVGWTGATADQYRRMVTEADEMVDLMRDGFKRAARGVEDYATAVRKAIDLIRHGAAAEQQLQQLIASGVPQWRGQKNVVVMRQWSQLRKQTAPAVERIRQEGNRLYDVAADYYGTALNVETRARAVAVDDLGAACRMLPHSPAAGLGGLGGIITSVPGLVDKARALSNGPLARKPSAELVSAFQTPRDKEFVNYPSDWRAAVAPLVLGSDFKPKKLTASEAAILDELPVWRQPRLNEIVHNAYEEGTKRFTNKLETDGHYDAFRHVYASAMMSREFGEDWTRRYTTAHEAVPAGQVLGASAMDLHNNALGMRLAADNPGLSAKELADLVERNIRDGHAVLSGADGTPRFSDQVVNGKTGKFR